MVKRSGFWLGVIVALGGAAVAAASPVSRSSRVECVPRWRVVVHSNAIALSDVVALSPTNVWATGQSPAVYHWDGRTLRRDVLISKDGELDGVAAVSSRDVWAVGSINTPTARPLIAHWSGAAWTVMTAPKVGRDAGLAAVTAIARDDVWAVGSSWAYAGDRRTRPLAMHWNGRAWSLVDVLGPAPQSSNLTAIDARAADDVWAVGIRNVDTETYDWGDLVLHWDGHRWSRVTSPLAKKPSGPFPVAVDVAPWGDVWTADVDDQSWFVHWIGRARAVTKLYSGYGGASDIAAVSPSSVWMVGDDGDGDYPVVAHWNGTAWTVPRTPFEALHATLAALSVLSPTELWAAGDHLIARYSCQR